MNESIPTVPQQLIGLDEAIELSMNPSHMALCAVVGDCLEGAGIVDGGSVLVDFSRRPAPPRSKSKGGDGSHDICLCYAGKNVAGTPSIMLKEYIGIWGNRIMVGTLYSREKHPGRLNHALTAKAILGVAIASFDSEENLIWKRNPDSFPAELNRAPSIHGDNIGDPRPLQPISPKESNN